jgi:hypothetical protein
MPTQVKHLKKSAVSSVIVVVIVFISASSISGSGGGGRGGSGGGSGSGGSGRVTGTGPWWELFFSKNGSYVEGEQDIFFTWHNLQHAFVENIQAYQAIPNHWCTINFYIADFKTSKINSNWNVKIKKKKKKEKEKQSKIRFGTNIGKTRSVHT